MAEIRWTNKQIDILRNIHAGNKDGGRCSVYDIMDQVSYECKRDAMLHSIRVLVKAGLVERSGTELRAGRQVRIFTVTTKALEYL